MTRRELLGLVGWLALTLIAAAVGALASVDAKDFYAQLVRPEWSPPAWVFGPVWSLLYLLMGVAAWLVWRTVPAPGVRAALALYVIQLAVNAVWSWLFFVWHRGALAFFGVLVLWILIVATVAAFWRLSAAAGALLLPYLAWVSFAALLTWTVWRLNPGLLG